MMPHHQAGDSVVTQSTTVLLCTSSGSFAHLLSASPLISSSLRVNKARSFAIKSTLCSPSSALARKPC